VNHFLIVYRRSTGELLEFADLGKDQAGADSRRFEHEQREKDDPDVEVVILSASSRAALQQTHSRYFKTMRELVTDLSDALPR
jgi:hypothetical protein